MRVAKIEKNSIANGPGVRLVVWCQGCSVRCKGCHNPQTWDMSGGRELNLKDLVDIKEYLANDYVDGVTFSGGNPLEPETVEILVTLLHGIRNRFPKKTIWLYTGFDLTYNSIMENNKTSECIRLCDVVVDGPYIESERDLRLPYCGSRNQRVIDIKQTLQNKKITLWEEQN